MKSSGTGERPVIDRHIKIDRRDARVGCAAGAGRVAEADGNRERVGGLRRPE